MGVGILDSFVPDEYPMRSSACPRCGRTAEQRFRGPCADCRAELRATIVGQAQDLDATYVPSMNVTPNAVAQKDD